LQIRNDHIEKLIEQLNSQHVRRTNRRSRLGEQRSQVI
jgi:hypothetical protein